MHRVPSRGREQERLATGPVDPIRTQGQLDDIGQDRGRRGDTDESLQPVDVANDDGAAGAPRFVIERGRVADPM
jgi:hypothetical protein